MQTLRSATALHRVTKHGVSPPLLLKFQLRRQGTHTARSLLLPCMPLAHRWLAREIPPDLIADLFENIWEIITKLFGTIFPKIGFVKSIMSFFWYNIPKIDMGTGCCTCRISVHYKTPSSR